MHRPGNRVQPVHSHWARRPLARPAPSRDVTPWRTKKKVRGPDPCGFTTTLPRASHVQGKLAGRSLVVLPRCIPCEECVKLDDEPWSTRTTGCAAHG